MCKHRRTYTHVQPTQHQAHTYVLCLQTARQGRRVAEECNTSLRCKRGADPREDGQCFFEARGEVGVVVGEVRQSSYCTCGRFQVAGDSRVQARQNFRDLCTGSLEESVTVLLARRPREHADAGVAGVCLNDTNQPASCASSGIVFDHGCCLGGEVEVVGWCLSTQC